MIPLKNIGARIARADPVPQDRTGERAGERAGEPALLWPNCRDVVDGTLTTATRRAGELAGSPFLRPLPRAGIKRCPGVWGQSPHDLLH